MGQSKEMALRTIAVLKEHYPDYYERLYPKCQICKNIMSSEACDMCEDFDMFVKVKEETIC